MKALFENKALSLALILGLLHVLCDAIGSLTFYPITHYGMYSEVFPRQESYHRYELVVNGKKLDALDFRIHVWEALTNPLAIQEKIKHNNDYQKDKYLIRRGLEIMRMSSLYPFVENKICNQPQTEKEFIKRYQLYLEAVLKQPVRSLQVYSCEYGYEKAGYFLIRKTMLYNE